MVFGWVILNGSAERVTGESEDAHDEVYNRGGGYDNPNHEAKFSHELVAGAASFEGFKLFEDHQRKEGKTVDHAFAKELLAGFVGGEVDKLVETKGMDEYDRERAHSQAKESAHHMYDEHYVRGQGANEYNPNQYDAPDRVQQSRGYGGGGYGRGNEGGYGGGYGGGRNY
ncbi:MAG: hypothetical protein M1836_000593 [Candelina mexicana]|nr:MAG: hypothetical protein M1836_000593 [Candelina mexicana]